MLEMKFTRYYGHFEGDQQTYRGDEVARARADLDCLVRFRREVTEAGQLTDADLDAVDAEIATLIDRGGRSRPRPRPNRHQPTC